MQRKIKKKPYFCKETLHPRRGEEGWSYSRGESLRIKSAPFELSKEE